MASLDETGALAINATSIQTSAFEYQQTNGIESWLGVSSTKSGLTVQPTRGEAVAAVFTIDNKTNDPTYFPPDISASVTRTSRPSDTSTAGTARSSVATSISTTTHRSPNTFCCR
jgi:hypothetical protein